MAVTVGETFGKHFRDGDVAPTECTLHDVGHPYVLVGELLARSHPQDLLCNDEIFFFFPSHA